ncbi:EAL domain-containing response regulator [Halomonas campisalis]|uniref:EAL domain-containing response regulator n=1 Tax=Billgrantia campisalis TaxID=74661 RepID=A0ABS9PA46_9GAMM|nr:EAL domain-containing response regulator [Halomonas campisalis]MCG6658511.1 EAL domain-containing response regulator [Halomonas campisalis]MDR5863372.1 EAL domain-containing response regulator [Halomonas campisalis]
MHDQPNQERALAVVLDEDPDVVAILSLQLHLLGMESRCCRRTVTLLDEVAACRPQLVIMGLESEDPDGIALLRKLAEQQYPGWVLLLGGVERKISRIAERVGQTLGLQMLGSLDKPMRLAELRQRLGGLRFGREPAIVPESDPFFSAEELERALEQGELTLHYQPQFELVSGRLSGVEALVRWAHPEIGLIGPASFLPMLTPGQSRRLTGHVLQLALADAERWQRLDLALSMSVNVTADDLMAPDLLARTRHRIPGASPPVVLEITETAAMDDELLGSEIAARLHLAGLEVSVDDFGVGFSSLSRLQMLPISELKIDRSFVRHLQDDTQDAAIVEAVALLGRRLGIRVIAEGVEELDCLGLLARFGCTHVQGFGLSRPVPAEAIPGLARAQSPIRASIAASGASPGSTP